MAHYEFTKDLQQGDVGEKWFVQYLQQRGAKILERNKTNAYDIRATYLYTRRVESTFEIKTDVYPKNTGNLFVEFECRGKPSGIRVSKAEWFVTIFPLLGEVWIIRTDTLKNIIYENQLKTTEQSGDEGSNTRGYLVPRNAFRDKFKVIRIDA